MLIVLMPIVLMPIVLMLIMLMLIVLIVLTCRYLDLYTYLLSSIVRRLLSLDFTSLNSTSFICLSNLVQTAVRGSMAAWQRGDTTDL